VKIFLRTRGRNNDYQFLGEEPEQSWWRSYANFTSFEEPSALLRADGHQWSLYLSAIPSARRDRVSTPIRWTLAAEGMCGPQTQSELTLDLLTTWLNNCESVGDLLDKLLPESTIENWFQSQQDPLPFQTSMLSQQATTYLQTFSYSKSALGPSIPQSWVGSIHSQSCQRAFLHHAESLLGGSLHGLAGVLNLLRNVEEIVPSQFDEPTLAILLDSEDSLLATPMALHEEVKKKVRHRTARPFGWQERIQPTTGACFPG
jgi:hypothetical protein